MTKKGVDYHMQYHTEWLMNEIDQGRQFEYVFFWGGRPNVGGRITKTCLSQWFPCRFEADGTTYFTAEQYMMAQKAALFGDDKTRARIMAATEPRTFKQLGQQVKPFDGAVWDSHKKDIVIKGNLVKFGQNEALKSFLLSTGGKILVEASPYDHIWGVGMAENEPDIQNPHAWRGENNLGFALMEVRDALSHA